MFSPQLRLHRDPTQTVLLMTALPHVGRVPLGPSGQVTGVGDKDGNSDGERKAINPVPLLKINKSTQEGGQQAPGEQRHIGSVVVYPRHAHVFSLNEM